MKRIVLVLMLFLVLGVTGAGVFAYSIAATARQPVEIPADSAEFEVPKGANAKTVGKLLEEKHLVSNPLVWRFVVWNRGGLKLKAGKFKLEGQLSTFDIADALEKSPLAEDEPFVVVEGFRIRDTDEALVEAGRINAGEYIKAASSADGYSAPFTLPKSSLEGYLYPETYQMPKGHIDSRQLVQKQLDLFGSRVFSPNEEALKAQKRSLHEVVTMASMLEREEPTPSNRPLVAGILWKRITQGWPLGVDATSRYELEKWNDRKEFLVKLRDQSDPYNSRYKKGLPPTPIGAPTTASFEAALKPTETEYLYYLHDSNHVLHPSRNAEEHEALRKKYDVY
jgi:UPF0755 protein